MTSGSSIPIYCSLASRSSGVKQQRSTVSAVFFYHTVVSHNADFPATQRFILFQPVFRFPAHKIDEGVLREHSSIGVIAGIRCDKTSDIHRGSEEFLCASKVVGEVFILSGLREVIGARGGNLIHDFIVMIRMQDCLKGQGNWFCLPIALGNSSSEIVNREAGASRTD